MGAPPQQLMTELRDRIGLVRAIETGTYRGAGALTLARVFPQVTTIELDEALFGRASKRLAGEPRITVVHGNSRDCLAPLVDPASPTLYWLDGHWSGGSTAGEEDECPVLEELDVLALGHQDDCILIDDARLFTQAPPPPHRPEQWPSYAQVTAAIRSARPEHVIAVAHDIVAAVPRRAADLLQRFASAPPPRQPLLRRLLAR